MGSPPTPSVSSTAPSTPAATAVSLRPPTLRKPLLPPLSGAAAAVVSSTTAAAAAALPTPPLSPPLPPPPSLLTRPASTPTAPTRTVSLTSTPWVTTTASPLQVPRSSTARSSAAAASASAILPAAPPAAPSATTTPVDTRRLSSTAKSLAWTSCSL